VSSEIIMTTSVTRPCFTTQHQTCKTKTKTDFLVSGWFCPKTDRRPQSLISTSDLFYYRSNMPSLCDEAPHTMEHWLLDCPALSLTRTRIFGSHDLNPDVLATSPKQGPDFRKKKS